MAGYSRGTKVGTIIWSVVIAVAVLALGISILLPSTKRARLDFRHMESEPTTEPTTEPSTQSATQPDVNVTTAPAATQP